MLGVSVAQKKGLHCLGRTGCQPYSTFHLLTRGFPSKAKTLVESRSILRRNLFMLQHLLLPQHIYNPEVAIFKGLCDYLSAPGITSMHMDLPDYPTPHSRLASIQCASTSVYHLQRNPTRQSGQDLESSDGGHPRVYNSSAQLRVRASWPHRGSEDLPRFRSLRT